MTRICSQCRFWNAQDRDRSHSGYCTVNKMSVAFNDGCKAFEPFTPPKDYSQYYTTLGYYPGIFFDLQDKE